MPTPWVTPTRPSATPMTGRPAITSGASYLLTNGLDYLLTNGVDRLILVAGSSGTLYTGRNLI